jgi:hypothetical protein
MKTLKQEEVAGLAYRDAPDARRRIASFIEDVEKDIVAVRDAIISPWSNGQTEGQITNLKLVMRQMYGRAKIDSSPGASHRCNLGCGRSESASAPYSMKNHTLGSSSRLAIK